MNEVSLLVHSLKVTRRQGVLTKLYDLEDCTKVERDKGWLFIFIFLIFINYIYIIIIILLLLFWSCLPRQGYYCVHIHYRV